MRGDCGIEMLVRCLGPVLLWLTTFSFFANRWSEVVDFFPRGGLELQARKMECDHVGLDPEEEFLR